MGRESYFLSKDLEGSLADPDLISGVNGLAILVESHHDDCGSVLKNLGGLRLELGLASLERNAVDYALSLRLLDSSLDDLELGGVNHDGHFRDVGVREAQSHELRHRLLPVDQSVVQVEIKDLGTVFNLVLGHLDGCVVVVVLDQLFEPEGA